MQESDDGVFHLVSFLLPKLKKHQQVFTNIKEALALVLSVEHYQANLSSILYTSQQ